MVKLICVASVLLLAAVQAHALALCGNGARLSCVVDGDTIRVSGEKIRLADIDAPERGARCMEEREMAERAARRLSQLLGGAFEITRGDPVDGRVADRCGRTLAVITVNDVSVGEMLISEGLARRWTGRRAAWCR